MATTGTDATVAFLKHFHPEGPWPLTRNAVTGTWSPKMRAVTDVEVRGVTVVVTPYAASRKLQLEAGKEKGR